MEYASNGKGNLGVTLGAVGTGLSVLNGGLGLLSGSPMVNNYVSRDEAKMMHELSSKDAEIALLKAEQSSEIKMTEVYKQSHAELVTLRDRMDARLDKLRDDFDDFRRDQCVANAKMSDSIAVLGDKVATVNSVLAQITAIRVPNSAVCPGWGNVTITPQT